MLAAKERKECKEEIFSVATQKDNCTMRSILILLTAAIAASPVFAAESAFIFPESNLSVEGRVTLLAIDDRTPQRCAKMPATLSEGGPGP